MKKIGKILGIVLGILVVLYFGRNIIVKSAVQTGARAIVGLKLDIQKLNIDVFDTSLSIKNFKVYNPSGFKDKIMADIPEITVNYELAGLSAKKIHFNEITLDLAEMTVVKNKDGKVNINSIKGMDKDKEKPKEPAKDKDGGISPSDIKIDLFTLKVGKVIFKDYTNDGEPDVKEFAINLNESYQDIDNPTAMVSLIVAKALFKTSIASLANVNLDAIAGSAKAAGEAATKAIMATTDKTKETLKATSEKTKETLNATTDKLKGVLKNPFGE